LSESTNHTPKFPKARFAPLLLAWFAKNRRDFPWRETNSPYKIAVAEALLQKTAAINVLLVYEEFLARFPRVEDLAQADEDIVLDLLQPLGLPARSRRLHQLAIDVTVKYNGEFLQTEQELRELPGVGPYGAAAIACQAFGEHAPMIDINVMRIFHRVFSVAFKPRNAPTKALRALVLDYMPEGGAREYNLALLDLGALLCHSHAPECNLCPLVKLCNYHLEELNAKS